MRYYCKYQNGLHCFYLIYRMCLSFVFYYKFMIITLLIVLIVLWLLGYLNIGFINIPDITLLTINGRSISLWDLLILLVVGIIIKILPGPFRQIAAVLLILWVLSVLGILSIAGLSNILLIAIIIGLVFFVIRGV